MSWLLINYHTTLKLQSSSQGINLSNSESITNDPKNHGGEGWERVVAWMLPRGAWVVGPGLVTIKLAQSMASGKSAQLPVTGQVGVLRRVPLLTC